MDSDCSHFDVLPFDIQINLCRQYRAGMRAAEQLAFSPPADIQVWQHSQEIIHTGIRAREILILHTTGLVKTLAKQFHYTTPVLAVEDLEHDGFIGLFRAIQLFDPTQNIRFVTYAHYWIRQAMQRSILAVGKTMKVPAHRQGMLAKIYKTRQRLEQEYGTFVTCEQVAQEAGVEYQVAQTIWWADSPALSLNNAITIKPFEEKGEYLDALQSLDTPVQDVVTQNDVRSKMKAVLEGDYLQPREAKILYLYFYEDKTLEEIGGRYGLSRERVRQIKNAGQAKLAQHPDIRNLWHDLIA